MIYVNGRFLGKKMDGIGRFSIEICKQLKEIGLPFCIIIPKNINYVNKEGFNIINYGRLRSHFWEQIDLLKFLRLNNKPLLLNLSGLGPLFYENQIITIHDLSFYVNKKWFSRTYTWFYSTATPIIAKRAKKIITVSDFSKSEIIKYMQLNSNKIAVVGNAVSKCLTNKEHSQKPKISINGKYVLAVSSVDPRKNLQRLINIFSRDSFKDYTLVLVGNSGKHFNGRLTNRSQNIVIMGFVSNEELLYLYQNCELFIYPSLYEGFGIPPLEAMSNGCAVIVSRIPSLQEVCGDAALYIDPYDENDIEYMINKIIGNPQLKRDYQIKGRERARMYDWNVSGRKVYDLIEAVKALNS